MGDAVFEAVAQLVPANYVSMARNAATSVSAKFKHTLTQKRIPDDGWTSDEIELFIRQVAAMDSNMFPGNVGAGERESRIASRIVAQRHFNLGHGIGRSGDILSVQPKAVGSSLISHLTNHLISHAMQISGLQGKMHCFVTPFATGMALALCMLRMRHARPEARWVIVTRCDQKSHLKSIEAAGFKPRVVPNILSGDELVTDVVSVQAAISDIGPESVLCVLAVTSCFAPRAPDNLPALAKVCSESNVPFLVNNAYGMQSTKCVHLLNEAHRIGRVDAFVQSCDKNFLVPVGGAIIAGKKKDFIDSIAALYPGRASATPSLDVLITLLELGASGYKRLLDERKDVFVKLKKSLEEIAKNHGERVLATPANNISLGLTLGRINRDDVTKLGAMLFTRNVSGARVVSGTDEASVAGVKFQGWAAHAPNYPVAYLTVAAAIGMKSEEVDVVVKRLDKVLEKISRD